MDIMELLERLRKEEEQRKSQPAEDKVADQPWSVYLH